MYIMKTATSLLVYIALKQAMNEEWENNVFIFFSITTVANIWWLRKCNRMFYFILFIYFVRLSESSSLGKASN